jgi:hypothetical protein
MRWMTGCSFGRSAVAVSHKTFVVDAMIFMSQRIADAYDVSPRRVGITPPHFLRESPRRFGNNLDRTLGNAAKAVAFPISLEAQARQFSRKAFDFITHMK